MNTLDWNELIGLTIKSVFYFDEQGDTGIFLSDYNSHLIEQGWIVLEFENKTIVEIIPEFKNNGITAILNNNKRIELEENKIDKDNFWSKISNKTIYSITPHLSYLEEKSTNDKWIKIELVSIIEITFAHREKVFISNAGFLEEDKVIPLADDFLVFNKKATAVNLGLLKS